MANLFDMTDVYNKTAEYLGISVEWIIFIFLIVGIWALVWKGFALWKSAKKNQLIWFIVLLVMNTVGILEILYIYVFSEIKIDKKTAKKKR